MTNCHQSLHLLVWHNNMPWSPITVQNLWWHAAKVWGTWYFVSVTWGKYGKYNNSNNNNHNSVFVAIINWQLWYNISPTSNQANQTGLWIWHLLFIFAVLVHVYYIHDVANDVLAYHFKLWSFKNNNSINQLIKLTNKSNN